MSHKKAVVRRFQQLLIVLSVLSLASLISCGSDEKVITIENQLNAPITVSLKAFLSEVGGQGIYKRFGNFINLDPGEKTQFPLDNLGKDLNHIENLAFNLQHREGDYYIWINVRSIMDGGCIIAVTDSLVDEITSKGATRDEFTFGLEPVVDPNIINPSPPSNLESDC